MKYLLYLLLFFSVSVFASTGGVYTTHATYPDDSNYPTDAKCASGDADVKIIDADADWDDINSTTFKYFCVEPGDYTAKNIPNITQAGTALARRYIRYYDPAGETHETHPVHMANSMQALQKQLAQEKPAPKIDTSGIEKTVASLGKEIKEVKKKDDSAKVVEPLNENMAVMKEILSYLKAPKKAKKDKDGNWTVRVKNG